MKYMCSVHMMDANIWIVVTFPQMTVIKCILYEAYTINALFLQKVMQLLNLCAKQAALTSALAEMTV